MNVTTALRMFASLALCFLLPLTATRDAFAQAWPARPIKVIVTYPPGGGADTMARLIAPKLSDTLGQPVIVENRPGASGQIGASEVARAAPDGYTLLFDASSYAVNPSLYAKLPYDPHKAFAAITVLARFPNMLVVTPTYGVKDVKDLVAQAKAKPGTIAYASSGNGSAQHLAAELFRQQTGVDMIHVPYKGGGPAMTDVMAGQVPVFFANMASGSGHVKAGKLRALASTGGKRSAGMPELPTMAEAGVPGYEVYEWNALFAPAGTPEAVIMRLQAAVAKALATPDVKERVAGLGGEIVASTPKETEKYLADQMALWAKVVKTAGIKVD